MSLKLNERYPSRFNNPSSDYPQGSFKNRTAPGALDGSYLEQDWANDKEGFFQSLLTSVSVVANGLVDKVGASQYFNAMMKIFSTADYAVGTGVANVYAAAYAPAVTELSDGMVLRFRALAANTGASTFAPNGLAAAPLVSLGQIALVGGEIIAGSVCTVVYSSAITSWVLLSATGVGAATQAQVNAGTNAATFVTPLKLRFGFDISMSGIGYIVFPSWLGGLVIQWGFNTGLAGAAKTLTFPLVWPNAMRSIVGVAQGTSTTSISVVFDNTTLSTSSIQFRANNSANATIAQGIYWLAIGN